ETFAGIDVATGAGNSFFIYDSERNLAPQQRWPFATLVTNDEYDSFSNLNRPGVFRLNIGVSKATFRDMFPELVKDSKKVDVQQDEYDFTALDRWMPHPVYGKMYWVCVLNPSAATFETVKRHLGEAYEMSVRKVAKAGGAEES